MGTPPAIPLGERWRPIIAVAVVAAATGCVLTHWGAWAGPFSFEIDKSAVFTEGRVDADPGLQVETIETQFVEEDGKHHLRLGTAGRSRVELRFKLDHKPERLYLVQMLRATGRVPHDCGNLNLRVNGTDDEWVFGVGYTGLWGRAIADRCKVGDNTVEVQLTSRAPCALDYDSLSITTVGSFITPKVDLFRRFQNQLKAPALVLVLLSIAFSGWLVWLWLDSTTRWSVRRGQIAAILIAALAAAVMTEAFFPGWHLLALAAALAVTGAILVIFRR